MVRPKLGKGKNLTDEECAAWRAHFRKLSNSARYDEAYALARRLMKRYPKAFLFAYYEAVMTAEDDTSYTPAEKKRRFALASKKLRRLLLRIRAAPPWLRGSVRNEYYWFSQQPHKQYRLGVERVRNGERRAYYSQGVGAVYMARKLAEKGRRGLALRWAKKAEKAWLGYYAIDASTRGWYNSYLFYAASLGYQGRLREMEKALGKAAKLSGHSPNWSTILVFRGEIEAVVALLHPAPPTPPTPSARARSPAPRRAGESRWARRRRSR